MIASSSLVGFALLAYLVVIAVLAALLYLVIRFGIRDGLRAHERWMRRTDRP